MRWHLLDPWWRLSDWQGFRPPQNQANAPLNLENSSLKKCPKPSGQGFRPPPQTGNAQIEGETSWKGLPLLLMSESRKLLRYVNIFTYREWWQKVKGRGAVVWVWWDSGQRTFSSRRGCLWGNLFPPSHPQISLLFLWFYLMFLFCSCLYCTGFDQGCGWWKCRFHRSAYFSL